MYIILKGKVGIFINTLDSFPIKISSVELGGFFGEMGLIDNNPRSATAIAETDCSVIAINKANFNRFVQGEPDMAYRIMKALSMRVRKSNDGMVELRREIFKLKGGDLIENYEYKKQANLISDFISTSSIFPLGHKECDLNVPATHYQYLLVNNCTCPVCEKTHKVELPKIFRIILDKTTKDSRTLYYDFDLILYSIIVCPNCNYARFYNETYKLASEERVNLIVKSYATKGKSFKGFSDIRTYNEIFEAYYIALYNYTLIKSTPSLTFAKLWMNLSWLYQDCHDHEMYIEAARKALDYYEDSYITTCHTITSREDQQMNLILGELKLLANMPEQAAKHFFYILNMESANNYEIYKYAEEELQALIEKGIEISKMRVLNNRC